MRTPHTARLRKVWIDLDNSPHVPFFVPIIRELERRGHTVVVTTRDCFQVSTLADHYNLRHKQIGRHYGANKLLKVLGTLWRSLQLAPTVIKEQPTLSLSHGSRALVLLSSMLRIPTVLLFDYEHARTLPLLKPELGIAPEAIGASSMTRKFKSGLRVYQGLKEDVYASSFVPDPAILQYLGLRGGEVLATIRPPATEAHYHNRESEVLFSAVVDFLATVPDVVMVILPRNERTQRDLVYTTWPDLCRRRRIIVPDRVVDGLNLVWHSDLVVSGGGTMNREAAALGVPVYSIFRGKLGAVDRSLAEQGRLVLIQSLEDVKTKIRPCKRSGTKPAAPHDNIALSQIICATEELLRRQPES